MKVRYGIFPMPEGRVLWTGSTFTQEFIITDQQGNARVSFQNNGSGSAVVKQENSYYGFGMQLANSPVTPPSIPNKQLYNGGSEWQNDYTGNPPDYYQTFNRNYDAALGRFISVDPKAESAESMTGYQYSGNNPIMFNDPLGDLLPMPGSHTPPPYQNVGSSEFGSGVPADIQASIDGFYNAAEGGLFATDAGLAWFLGSTGQAGGDEIYNAGNKSLGEESTGSLSNAVAMLNSISAANGGKPLNGNTFWVYLAADGSILHQDSGDGAGGTHYYQAGVGELGGQTVYNVAGEVDNQGGVNRPLAPSNFNFQPSFGSNWQAAGIRNVSIYLLNEQTPVIFNLEIGMPTKSLYLRRTISRQEAQRVSSKAYLKAMNMVMEEYSYDQVASATIPNQVASWMQFFINSDLGGFKLATVTTQLGTNPGAPVRFADYNLTK